MATRSSNELFRTPIHGLQGATDIFVIGNAQAISATGNKYAFCGPVWFKERTGTKAIRRVGFRFGSVTKAGGSGLTVSLQNVSTVASPIQPDETQDQTVAIANGDANFAANTWCRTNALSADRTVSFGEMLAVVFEYNGSGRLGADTFKVSTLSLAVAVHGCCSVKKVAGTWSVETLVPNLVLEFSDGTFGTLYGAFPFSAVGSQTFNSGTGGADEYALEVDFSKDVEVDLANWDMTMASSSADFESLIYSGTTALSTVVMDASHRWSSTESHAHAMGPTRIALTGGQTYRYAVRPTTVNSVIMRTFDVSDANHLTCHVGGPSWALTSRVDQGAWAAPTTTRRLWMNPAVLFDFPVGTPPTPDASWPCNIGKPIFWGAVTDVDANVFQFGQKPLRDGSTYYGGYKAPRLLEMGDIGRVASDFLTGSWQAQTATMRVADTDHFFRNKVSFLNRTAWFYAYSEAIRAAGGNPTLLFHGPIYHDPPAADLVYEFNANDFIGAGYNLLQQDKMVPQRTFTSDDFSLPSGVAGLGVPIIGGTISETGGGLKCINAGIINVGGIDYAIAAVCGHACAGGITNAYDKNGAALVWGTDAFAPGKAGWTTIQPGGELYWDINDNRYTLIFIVASSTIGIDFIAGTTGIYVNTNGMEATGAGTGAVITDLLTLYWYLLEYWFTQSYTSGAWPSAATFEFYPGMGVGSTVINKDSFDAASAQSAIYLGGGFVGGFVIGAGGRRISIRTAVQQCNVSCNVFMGVNAQSQIFVNMFNTNLATLIGTNRTITDRRDILRTPKPSIQRKKDWFVNDFGYQYGENYRADGTGQWNGFNIQGLAPSQTAYGVSTGFRTYSLVRDGATADAIAGLQMRFGGTDPPMIITWTQSLCGMAQDILTAFPMTFFGGTGASGWVGVPVYILGQVLHPRNCTVTFTGIDVSSIAS